MNNEWRAVRNLGVMRFNPMNKLADPDVAFLENSMLEVVPLRDEKKEWTRQTPSQRILWIPASSS